MMVRNSLSELRISPSTVSIFSRASIWCRPRFSHAEAGLGQNPYTRHKIKARKSWLRSSKRRK